MVGARISNLRDGQNKSAAEINAPVTQPEAAKMLNVSRESVQCARVVLEHGIPELIKAVGEGKMSVTRVSYVDMRHFTIF
jgi:hypothetical protein